MFKLKEFLKNKEKTKLAFMILLTSILIIAVEGFWYFILIVILGILFFVIMPYFSKLFDLFYNKVISKFIHDDMDKYEKS